LEGVPHFCHAVALVEGGRPVVAVLYNPATEEFYEAIAGRGALLNGYPIRTSDRQEIEGCRMAAFGPMFKHRREPWPKMQIIHRDSVAYRLALVASGEADAAFGLYTKRDWDLAAADLIVHEAEPTEIALFSPMAFLEGAELCGGRTLRARLREHSRDFREVRPAPQALTTPASLIGLERY